MTKNNNISLKDIYELVDGRIAEVKSSMLRLETKFDALEAGRLSTLETNFANLQGKLTIIAAVISIALNVFFLVINKFV